MASYMLPGLTPEAASRICMLECKAMCCRGPLVLRLTKDEVSDFRAHASKLGTELTVGEAPDRGGWVRFADHPGERCPMLDDATSACRIYEDRPQRCRDFPEKPTPGCAISFQPSTSDQQISFQPSALGDQPSKGADC